MYYPAGIPKIKLSTLPKKLRSQIEGLIKELEPEVEITTKTRLELLYRFYRSEKVKKRKNSRVLKKAERLLKKSR